MNDELKKFAYLDNELSPAEKREFEKNLTPEQKQELAAERRLEKKLQQVLAREEQGCPEQLWSELKSKLEKKDASGSQSSQKMWGIFATAASLLFVLFALLGSPSSEHRKVQQTLSQLGIHFVFPATIHESGEHQINFIQASTDKKIRIEFSCCGTPVVVHIEKNFKNKEKTKVRFQLRKKVGNYQIVALSNHPPTAVLNLFKEI